MEDKPFQALNKKIDMIIKLLAQSLVKGMNTKKEKIVLLYSIGYMPVEISTFLGTTRNSVNVTITNAKKEGLL